MTARRDTSRLISLPVVASMGEFQVDPGPEALRIGTRYLVPLTPRRLNCSLQQPKFSDELLPFLRTSGDRR